MSKFKTSIPVDVASVLETLPAGHYLHGVTWNAADGCVDVVWEHDAFVTQRDFPLAFPATDLKDRTRPEGVTVDVARLPSPPAPESEAAPAPNEPAGEGDLAASEPVPTGEAKPVVKARRRN